MRARRFSPYRRNRSHHTRQSLARFGRIGARVVWNRHYRRRPGRPARSPVAGLASSCISQAARAAVAQSRPRAWHHGRAGVYVVRGIFASRGALRRAKSHTCAPGAVSSMVRAPAGGPSRTTAAATTSQGAARGLRTSRSRPSSAPSNVARCHCGHGARRRHPDRGGDCSHRFSSLQFFRG